MYKLVEKFYLDGKVIGQNDYPAKSVAQLQKQREYLEQHFPSNKRVFFIEYFDSKRGYPFHIRYDVFMNAIKSQKEQESISQQQI